MKVIFLTQYFPPETGAPQNRIHATATALAERGASVSVLTGMPNYPGTRVHEGYRGKWFVRERMGVLDVLRAPLYVPSGRGFAGRLMNYFSFVCSSLVVGLFKLKRSDVLFVESPPLFLGITAMWLARAKRARLVFNVSDLWPESAVALGLVRNRFLIRLSTALEMRCYRRSALITGQTQGIVRDIRDRCPGKCVIWLPNGIDPAAIADANATVTARSFQAFGVPDGSCVLVYAGILGHAQGLEVILEAARLLGSQSRVHMVLIGDGPERANLVGFAEKHALDNVHFVERMPRAELLQLLQSANGMVVPLRRNDLFKGAIPSKIFEALALAKPILLGVEGEAKELFIDQGSAGVAFMPEDARDLAQKALRVRDEPDWATTCGANGKRYVEEHFDRRRISERLYKELQQFVRHRSNRAGLSSTPPHAMNAAHRVLPKLPDRPRVIVSIPCRNERGFIGACLRSIVAADRSGCDLSVYVCDGMSDDGTRAEVTEVAQEHSFITLVDNPQRTTPFALNLGLRAAGFDVGIILGAHAEVETEFFSRSIAALRNDLSVGCAGGMIENVYTDRASRCIGAAMGHPFGVGNAHFRTGTASGYVDTVAFGAYRREVFDAVGWFDEALERNQDDEFNFRLTKAGFRVLLDPSIRSRYVVRARIAKLWRQYNQYGLWKVYVNKIHGTITTMRQLVPAVWVAFLAVFVVASLIWPSLCWLLVAGIWAYALVAFAVAIRLVGIADAPMVVAAFVVLHLGYGTGYWQGIFRFLLLRREPSAAHRALTR